MEDEITKKLKEKKLSDNTIKLYITILKNLNDKREIKNFKYLDNPKKILKKIKDYKITTQRNIIIAIVSVLKNIGDDLYKQYYDHMIEYNKKVEEEAKKNKKSEQQKENWLSFEDVKKKYEDLKSKIKLSKNISEDQYNNILDVVLLGLYVLIPPRRNKDYLLMKIGNEINNDNNWLDMKKKQFIFNKYKTEKTYGTQIVDIPDELFEIIKKYLKYKKDGDGYLLVKFNGDRLKTDNSITRRLNNIFDKKISSSMLRHIYLSDKYKNVKEEMKADSYMMAHSLKQQEAYIKK